MAQAIHADNDHLQDISAIVHYHQRRNHAAYRSHRKRTLKRHCQRCSVRRKRKVSE